MVLSWGVDRDGTITVRLISAELHRVCAPIVRRTGQGSGTGRIMSFEKQEGKWVYVSGGGWIS
jgi:hypothetical protein